MCNVKFCKWCNKEKPIGEFYVQKNSIDGHYNKCKECIKSYALAYRAENIEKIREYDRARGSRQSKTYLKQYREKYPNKYKAHTKLNNALRDGRIQKQPCEICGADSVAHHDDYSKPLEVRWLCQAHHKQWHAKHGEAKNA